MRADIDTYEELDDEKLTDERRRVRDRSAGRRNTHLWQEKDYSMTAANRNS
jgi:hypothetical protein